MTIYPPSAQLKTDMKKVGDTMTGDWAKKAGPDGQAVLDAYRKM
jgi:TRAP-type transport system periplasmic protein